LHFVCLFAQATPKKRKEQHSKSAESAERKHPARSEEKTIILKRI